MPYEGHDFQLEYCHKHRNQHLDKVIEYYYDNRTEILKQRKIKYMIHLYHICLHIHQLLKFIIKKFYVKY